MRYERALLVREPFVQYCFVFVIGNANIAETFARYCSQYCARCSSNTDLELLYAAYRERNLGNNILGFWGLILCLIVCRQFFILSGIMLGMIMLLRKM